MCCFHLRRPRALDAVVSALALATLLGACGERADPQPPALTLPSLNAAAFRVQAANGLVTVHAREATLRDIVEDIAAANGLALITQDALHDRVTVDFVAEPLVPALRKLLRGRGFVLQQKQLQPGAGNAHHGTLWVFTKEEHGVHSRAVAGQSARVESLTAALDNEDANLRMDAASDLGTLKKSESPTAVAALSAAATQDVNPSVRAEALYALSTLHVDARDPAFKHALTDTDREVREASVRALEDLGSEDAVKVLQLALNDSDPSIRAAAADALGEIGGSTAREALQRALSDGDGGVREAALSYEHRDEW